MIVISDSSCILNLARINLLNLLPGLFHEIIIPFAVFSEITNTGMNMPGADEIVSSAWIKVKSCTDRLLLKELLLQLDEGEAEAIVLAKELKADLLIIDEAKGREIARQNNL